MEKVNLQPAQEVIEKLIENGQVATQYVNENGIPTMNGVDNINGSVMAIEGIVSGRWTYLRKNGS